MLNRQDKIMQIKFPKIFPRTICFYKRELLYLLILIILSQSLTSGVVLCFGKDGHIEVEYGLTGACCATFKESTRGPAILIDSEPDCDNSCGICVDIPLYITSEKRHSTDQKRLNYFLKLFHVPYYFSSANHFESSPKSSFFCIHTSTYHISNLHTIILQV